MKKLLLLGLAMLPLTGCQTFNSLTSAQKAQVFCVLAADGTAIAVSSTKGGAAATAASVQASSVTACSAATQVGQIVGH